MDSSIVTQVTERIKLMETTDDGYTCVDTSFASPVFWFRNLRENGMKFFKCKKSPDHILIQWCDDGWVLHIMEFKRTIKASVWGDKVKEQFKGGLFNGLALAGFLGIEFAHIRCYTAYRYDKLSQPELSDVIELKRPLGDPTPTTLEEWQSENVALGFESRLIPHQKIQLDTETGEACIDIHCNSLR